MAEVESSNLFGSRLAKHRQRPVLFCVLDELKIAHKKAFKPISLKAKDVCWAIRPAGTSIIHVTLDLSVDQVIQLITFLTGLYGAGRFVDKVREKR